MNIILPPHWPHGDAVCQFSLCRSYRYTLWRRWEDRAWGLFEEQPSFQQYLMVIGLNPSTADERADDPTIRRCIDFAQRWGFGGLCMTNLFAFRATDPKVMKKHPKPAGPHNDHWLEAISKSPACGMVLAAWGAHGDFQDRNIAVMRSILQHRSLHALKITGKGHPGHPLYIPADTKPEVFLECGVQPSYGAV